MLVIDLDWIWAKDDEWKIENLHDSMIVWDFVNVCNFKSSIALLKALSLIKNPNQLLRKKRWMKIDCNDG